MKLSRSYPFMSIARHYDVDYGDVLLFGQYMRKWGIGLGPSLHEQRAMSNLHDQINPIIAQDFAAAIERANREFARIQREGW
jgi:hypothetical protein